MRRIPPTTVPIAEVVVDPKLAPEPGRRRYQIVLACGCKFGEDRPADAPAPQPGEAAQCFAGHVVKPMKPR